MWYGTALVGGVLLGYLATSVVAPRRGAPVPPIDAEADAGLGDAGVLRPPPPAPGSEWHVITSRGPLVTAVLRWMELSPSERRRVELACIGPGPSCWASVMRGAAPRHSHRVAAGDIVLHHSPTVLQTTDELRERSAPGQASGLLGILPPGSLVVALFVRDAAGALQPSTYTGHRGSWAQAVTDHVNEPRWLAASLLRPASGCVPRAETFRRHIGRSPTVTILRNASVAFIARNLEGGATGIGLFREESNCVLGPGAVGRVQGHVHWARMYPSNTGLPRLLIVSTDTPMPPVEPETLERRVSLVHGSPMSVTPPVVIPAGTTLRLNNNPQHGVLFRRTDADGTMTDYLLNTTEDALVAQPVYDER